MREALRRHDKPKPSLDAVPFKDTVERGLTDAAKGKVSKIDLDNL